MKIYKNIIILLIGSFIFMGCQNFKEGLAGNKRSKGSDEFLVQKKNPLVQPPNFEDLPIPSKDELLKNSEINENISVENILRKKSKTSSKNSTAKSKNVSLENSILKEINKN